VSWIHRRFAWKWTLIFLAALSVWETSRARYWFTILLPVLEYKPGWSPFLAQAGLFATGGLLAFIVMRVIEKRIGPAGSQVQSRDCEGADPVR
jgi:hypothetical protein